jgi:ketosteroid isomerase-like protein
VGGVPPEVDEYRELDGDRVLVFSRFIARGRKSGLELQTKGASLFQIQGGKVTRVVRYWNRDRALVDLGLSSEADSSPS